jgi:cation diffusion facilitator family transporter
MQSQKVNTSGGVGAAQTAAGREKRWVALSSVGAAIVLTGMKLVVGLLTGSLGLLAEAAHSGLDLVAAVITCFAVHWSDKPADAEHPYGHGKIENLSALAETLLLLATCAWIIYEGVERLFVRSVEVDATVASFAVIIVSIVIDISRSRALRRVAQKHNSQALEADALHFSTDVWSSAVVLLGLTLVKIGELTGNKAVLQQADAVAALVVALIVVWVSIRLGKRTIDVLLDRAPAGLPEAIRAAVAEVPGVLECKQVRLRQSGNQTFVDLVIGVKRGLSLEASHAVGAQAEAHIQQRFANADVVVHVDPSSSVPETLAERIQGIAANLGQTVHNIAISEEADGLHVELHLETRESLELRAAHAEAHTLEAALRRELPRIARLTTHIEPHREGQQAAEDVTAESGALLRRVQAIVARTPEVAACHDVALRRSGTDLVLTMHCTFAPGLPVRAVHEISSQLEQRLKAAIPGLVRVTTHPEPEGEEEGAP